MAFQATDGNIYVRDHETGDVTNITRAYDGGPAFGGVSRTPVISADDTHVAFISGATNLVPGDTNGIEDVFVRDMRAHRTIRVSVASDGSQQTGSVRPRTMTTPSISANGRLVAFASPASNLTPGDTNGLTDVFVHDLDTGQTTLVSQAVGGGVGDAPPGAKESPPAGFSGPMASISRDGTLVAFTSLANDLVSTDTNGIFDVFLRNLTTSQTERISVGSGDKNSYAPAISPNQQILAFTSCAQLTAAPAAGCVLHLKDLATGALSVEDPGFEQQPDNVSYGPSCIALNYDASVAAVIEWSTGPDPGIVIEDLSAGKVEHGHYGGYSDGVLTSITDDGRYVSYWTAAPPSYLPFEGHGEIFDRTTNTTISPAAW
ncbi:MAG: TolB family protein [Actinomycetota bacterium]